METEKINGESKKGDKPVLKEQGNGRSVPHPGRVLQQGAPAD